MSSVGTARKNSGLLQLIRSFWQPNDITDDGENEIENVENANNSLKSQKMEVGELEELKKSLKRIERIQEKYKIENFEVADKTSRAKKAIMHINGDEIELSVDKTKMSKRGRKIEQQSTENQVEQQYEIGE